MFKMLTPRAAYRLLLIALLGAFLHWRLSDLVEGKPSTLDIVVFIVWFALLLTPLFSELELFGLKFKQIVEDATQEVKREIASARSELAATIAVQSSMSQHITLALPEGSVPARGEVVIATPALPAPRSAMELKILNTLWTKQVNKFPDLSQRFTFRLYAHLPEFVEWRNAASKLLGEGLISETNEGQIFLTDKGFEYCKAHYTEFPKDQWWPEEPLQALQLVKVLSS